MSETKRSRGYRREEIIRASEIGSYVYCRRAWWLRRVGGYSPSRSTEATFLRGEHAHARHNRLVAAAYYARRLAILLLLAGGLLGIIALVLSRV